MDRHLNASAAMARPKSTLAATRSRIDLDPSVATDRSIWGGRVAIAFLLLIYAALWTVARPYRGLVHDARLYALQTLARVQPEVFSNDLFLRFGSQDRFTVFPLINAVLAKTLGLEPATALTTFVLSVAWLALGFLIARELYGTKLALLSVGALAVIPGWYGAYEVFQIGEMFLSARLPAEVLAMAALLAYLRRSYWVGLTMGLLSTLVHPLMALPMIGLLLLVILRERIGVGSTRAAVAVVVLGATVTTLLVPAEPANLHGEWLSVVQSRNPFLFLNTWRLVDWQNHALVLITLVLSARALANSQIRRLAICAAWIGAAGVILAAVASTLHNPPILLRVQPWRWMWVANLLAIILLPALLSRLLERGAGATGSTVASLMASAWLLGSSGGGIVATAAALTFFVGSRLPKQSVERMSMGAFAILAAVIAITAVSALQFAGFQNDTNRDPIWVQRLVNFVGPTGASLVAVASFWAIASTSRSRPIVIALAAASVLMLVALGPRAMRNWTEVEYSRAHYQTFDPWRSIIPKDAEVLWPGYTIATWLLLERRSFFSSDQLAGILYSPGMTKELGRRAAALTSLARPGWWTRADGSKDAKPKALTPEILFAVCRPSGPDFVVSERDVGGSVSRVRRPGRELDYYLYDCRNWRTGRFEPS